MTSVNSLPKGKWVPIRRWSSLGGDWHELEHAPIDIDGARHLFNRGLVTLAQRRIPIGFEQLVYRWRRPMRPRTYFDRAAAEGVGRP